MVKKLLLLSALSFTCFGDVQAGTYIGIGGGVERMGGKRTDISADSDNRDDDGTLAVGKRMKGHTPVLELFGGYEHLFLNGFYAAFEVGGHYRKAVHTLSEHDDSSLSMDQFKNSLSLFSNIKLGREFFKDHIFYGLFGLTQSNFSMIYKGDAKGESVKKKWNSKGLAWGVGYKWQFQPKLSLGVELKEERYKNKNLNVDLPARQKVDTSIKPKLTTFVVRLNITL